MAGVIDMSDPFDRQSLCMASPPAKVACHVGDQEFATQINRHYSSAESAAIEQLIRLKKALSTADTETFWTTLMEGMTSICNAQYGFVSKRVLYDDHDSAVEMPPIGAVGSCLLGTAFYFNDGKSTKAMHRDYKYHAWDCPCSYMKHDKVFLIPKELPKIITNNPNTLPFPAEAYLGVPLFSEQKCFAHFGMMWSDEGLSGRSLSWASVELILHALEDVILARLLAGNSFARTQETQASEKVEQVIPHEAVLTNQSLKPYARSLSHELRTPMQGVVGMLDVMHATVQEAMDGARNSKMRSIFKVLKENIEVVEDSSRRAVEAADNVVHAYDLNMEVQETSQHERESSDDKKDPSSDSTPKLRPGFPMEVQNTSANPYKRRKISPERQHGRTDFRHSPTRTFHRPPSPRSRSPVNMTEKSISHSRNQDHTERSTTPDRPVSQQMSLNGLPAEGDMCLNPNAKHSKIRHVLHVVINEGLMVGGRPDITIRKKIELGEEIDVRSRSSNGESFEKIIRWEVSPNVPQVIPVDERDLSKLISCVFLNAFKFTEAGLINITTNVAEDGETVLVNIADTGIGIPPDFLPQIFKPFSRKDDSLTRAKEGLGLGLLVAKGLARKIGGDIHCIRSETSGPAQGSEFEITIPLNVRESVTSRESTPFRSQHASASNHNDSKANNHADESPNNSSYTVREDDQGRSPLQRPPESRQNSKSSHMKMSSLSSSSSMSDWETMPNSKRYQSASKAKEGASFDRELATKRPLTFLVAEDSQINRRLLVTMLSKLGYNDVYQAFDGKEAVRVMKEIYDSLDHRTTSTSPVKRTSSRTTKPSGPTHRPVDLVLMDLWMPEMDGYEATEKILDMVRDLNVKSKKDLPLPTVLAVTADVTDEAQRRATQTGMDGFMTKPFKISDLQRLIEDFSLRYSNGRDATVLGAV